MIVRGTDEEAKLLNRCLDSVAPYVDGIFITRTHKKNEKPNAAVANVTRTYNGVVSDFEWCDDFSAARNFNFSQVPSSFDFIIWCDADDVWRGLEKLKDTIEKQKHADGFGFWYLYDWDDFKKPTVVHRKTMIIRNDGCATWVGRIHEDLQPNRQVEVPLIEGIDRLHISTSIRAGENAFRNLEIAKKQVKEEGEDPRSHWNLANSFFGVGKYQESVDAFEEFLETSESEEEKYLAHMRLGGVYKALGERQKAITEYQKAIGILPSLPDAYLQLAYNFFDFGNMDKAEEYALQGIVKRPQIMKMVVYNPRDYDYNPLMLLVRIYEQKNRPDLMLPLIKGCLKIYPYDEKLKKFVKDTEKDMKLLEKALIKVQELQKEKDKVKLRAALDALPDELKSHPAISVIRNQNFVKETSSGKDLVIYCGNTTHQWNPDLFRTKGFGGSEEAVIHMARELAGMGWNVTVYNNCGHKEMCVAYDKGQDIVKNTGKNAEEFPWLVNGNKCVIKPTCVTYKPFWEFNYRDKQDVVILWRWAKPLDAEINAPKIFLDLHDVIPEGELTEKRLTKVSKIFVKSKFHRSLFPHVPDDKFAIIPNGLEIYPDDTIQKDPYLIINTSSSDRSMDVLPKLFAEVKKRVPQARLQWAYGWEGFITTYQHDVKKMQWMEDTKQAMKDAGIEDLGRITQEEVGRLYQKASYMAYPTEFAEIDCISVKKALAGGCIPVTTDFGALKETNSAGITVHSKKTKDNWNKPYQFHFGLEDEYAQKEWVDRLVGLLESKWTRHEDWSKKTREEFAWSSIAERWNKELI